MTQDIQDRKQKHLDLCLNDRVRGNGCGLDDVKLPYDALFLVTPAQLHTNSAIAGIQIEFPLMFGAITGGTPVAAQFNTDLRRIAADLHIAMELGSIRALIEHPELLPTYGSGHVEALFANIGASEVSAQNFDKIAKTCEILRVAGLCIHLNGLQEFVQNEGNHEFSCDFDTLASFIARFPLPVLIKEVGSGIGGKCASTLAKLPIAGIETASLGGTSWISVEAMRRNPPLSAAAINALNALGYDLKSSIISCRNALGPHKTVIASGGISQPDEVVKSLSLGADLVAIAQPVYQIWRQNGLSALQNYLAELIDVAKIIWRSTGCKNIHDLHDLHVENSHPSRVL